MSSSLNKVLLIGNLGKDPEMRYTPDGLVVLNFSMATTESYKDKSGQKSENTTWHNVVCFGKMAQSIAQYLSKGKQVFVEGRISTSMYEDKKTGEKRYRTDIVANNIVLLGGKKSEESPQESGYQPDSDDSDGGEDIPF